VGEDKGVAEGVELGIGDGCGVREEVGAGKGADLGAGAPTLDVKVCPFFTRTGFFAGIDNLCVCLRVFVGFATDAERSDREDGGNLTTRTGLPGFSLASKSRSAEGSGDANSRACSPSAGNNICQKES
jgi:hypothetical protein